MVKVITDSTSDIPKELVDELGIEIAPLTVNFGQLSYRDGIDLTNSEFFEKLVRATVLPTTSQVSIGEFVNLFNENLETHDEILSIHISSDLSGTYNAAVQAKETIGSDRIHVVDSRLVAFGLGLMVVECAKKLNAGESLHDVAFFAENAHNHMRNIFIFDTLEYLLKGGRLSKNEAFLGSLLNIKPVLTIKDGLLKSIEKIRGRKKAVRYALNQIASDYEKQPFDRIAIYQSANSMMMEDILKRLEEEFDFVQIIQAEVGAVVGTHAGPGCAAISYIYKGELK
jgi:DegV family protein with EDD domain